MVQPTGGKIVVAWSDGYNGMSQVKVVSSSDGGAHWTVPTVVSADVLPALAVNAAGVVGLTYFSLTPPVTNNTVQTSVEFRTSPDGVTFSPPVPVGAPFDFKRAPLTTDAYFLGDYQGLAAVGTAFHPFFAMPAVAGSPNMTEIRTTAITP